MKRFLILLLVVLIASYAVVGCATKSNKPIQTFALYYDANKKDAEVAVVGFIDFKIELKETTKESLAKRVILSLDEFNEKPLIHVDNGNTCILDIPLDEGAFTC